jgi:hypothetical protein
MRTILTFYNALVILILSNNWNINKVLKLRNIGLKNHHIFIVFLLVITVTVIV